MNLQYVLWFLGSLVISLALFALMNRQAQRCPKPENLFSRIVSNGFVVFLFLLKLSEEQLY